MWLCSNCKSEIEDRYLHCWNCGAKRVVAPGFEQPHVATQTGLRREIASTPHFGSYEELVPEPRSHSALWRRGPFTRIFGLLIAAVFIGALKFFSSTFFGKYGLYIVVAVGGIVLVSILWRFFRRDKSEGVGIELD